MPGQIAGKLSYAHQGIYLIYLGAVFGSSGFIKSLSRASFINLDMVPADVSFNPNRSLSELFVN